MTRPVTERDLRLPEFRDANVEDYEFREDGAIVRKDRWIVGMHAIHDLVGPGGSEFEIDDVVNAVAKLKGDWVEATSAEDPEAERINIKLEDGSVLAGCTRIRDFVYRWPYGKTDFKREDFGEDVIEWQTCPTLPTSPS